jgi:glycosyltransferase involved in cell wall biosynthesis
VDVSVCIASYRRPEGLARLLASLGRIKLPDGVRVEILVVDNDPHASDAQPLPDAGGLPARRLREPERNIALARNRAVSEARGAWLAFVDDDETVGEDWLAAYLAAAERWACDGFFGPVLARAERPGAGDAWLPIFARARFASGTRVGADSARTGNAFVRRALFEELRFDPAYGRSGGSDSVFFASALARGAEFRWCDDAPVEEWLPPDRLSPRWLLRRAFRGGSSHGRRARAAFAPLRAGAALAALLALLPFACLGGKLAALRAAMRVARAAGRIHGLCGGRFEEYAG